MRAQDPKFHTLQFKVLFHLRLRETEIARGEPLERWTIPSLTKDLDSDRLAGRHTINTKTVRNAIIGLQAKGFKIQNIDRELYISGDVGLGYLIYRGRRQLRLGRRHRLHRLGRPAPRQYIP